MKRFLLFSILLFVGFVNVSKSADFYAVGGLWSNANSWASSRGGAGGAGVPGPMDNVFLEGNQMFIFGADASVNNVNVIYNVADQITIFGEVRRLTINGRLRSYELQEVPFLPPGSGVFAPVDREPNTNVIIDNPDLTLEFTRNGPIFQSWGVLAPIANMEVNTSGTSTISSNIEISGGNLSLIAGSLTILSGGAVSDNDFDSNFLTSASTILNVNGAIYGNSNSDRFNLVDIQGNITTGTAGYLNADNFTLGASSTFTINFNGTNQTQGWWYQSTGPTGTFDLNPSSTIIYNASADQVVGAQEYGNLRLRSQSGASVKTLQSTGNLLVQGLLRLNSANVTFDTSPNSNPINIEGEVQNLGNFSPSQLVIFSGTTAQSINGANEISFDGGMRVSNTAGLILNNIGIDINGELDIDPSCSFDPSDQVVTILGDMRIDGTLIAGTNPGGFIFDGTTEFLGSGTRGFYDWTIDASSSVLAPSGTLTVHRNWINNGIFDNNEGSVSFADIGTKSISGSATTTFWNLSAEGGRTDINGSVNLENVLSFVGSPIVDLDGSGSGEFTLLSSETRDAAIDNIGSATVEGNMNVQRAIYTVGGDGRGYHIVGFPVTGLTVAEIQDELSVTGSFSGASACPTSNCVASIYSFNEVAAGNGVFNNGYLGFPTSGNGQSFINGEGYYIFNYAGEPSSGIIEGNGTVFSGNFSTNLSRTGTSDGSGWHMVANPYPAATDWSQWSNGNVEGSTAWLYNPSSQAYEALDGSIQQLIPQGQGFFVRALSNGVSLSATEGSKVTGSTPTYFRTSPQERFEIILKTPDYDDRAIVSFNPDASDNYEPRYDAIRLLNTYETLSMLTEDGEMVKVNRLAPVGNNSNCSRIIKLNLEQMVVGDNYAIDFTGVSSVSTQKLSLKDNFLNTENIITENLIYDFQITEEVASQGSERFEIVLESRQPKQLTDLVEEVCAGSNSIFTLKNTESNVNYLITKKGEIVTTAAGNGSSIDIEIINEFLTTGINDFAVEAFISSCDTVTVGSIQISQKESINSDINVSANDICGAQQVPVTIENAQKGKIYNIIDTGEEIMSVTAENDGQITFLIDSSYISAGLNQFDILIEGQDCGSVEVLEAVEFDFNESALIETVANQSICSQDSAVINLSSSLPMSNYQLFVGEELVMESGTSTITLNPTETTTYTLKGESELGCSSNTVSFTVEVADLLKPGILVSDNVLESSVEGDSYQWYFNGEALNDENGKLLVVNQSGDYAVEVIKGNCTEVSDVFTFTEEILNVSSVLEDAIYFYPNPVEDKMLIEFNGIDSLNVTIFTVSGKFIDSFELDSRQSQIDMSKFAKGTYLIQFESGESSVTKRIVKQ